MRLAKKTTLGVAIAAALLGFAPAATANTETRDRAEGAVDETKGWVEGAIDSVTGTVKDTIGSLTGDAVTMPH